LNEGQVVEWGSTGKDFMDLQGISEEKSEIIYISYPMIEEVWQKSFEFQTQTYQYLIKNLP